MYCGCWQVFKSYKIGDIIQVNNDDYYICIKDHISDNLTFPNKEDIYWLNISRHFLQSLKSNKDDNLNNIVDDFVENLIQNEIKNNKTNLNNNSSIKPFKVIKPKSAIYNKKRSLSVDRDLDYQENSKQNELKRKIRLIESDIQVYKRQKNCEYVDNLRNQLLFMNLNIETKSFLVDKFDSTKDMNTSDCSKTMNWLKTVVKIPYGNFKGINVKPTDPTKKLREFFENVKSKLDNNIYGLENVKQEILEFVARKITSPNSKGHVLALCGNAGVGKSKIIKSLSEALDLPFYQINFGGLNDVSILTGHSETYVGSKPGKIVEILTSCKYMNPIIYLDEIDKISESKATEIFGILTHLLDEEQNCQFQDNYLSNITLDLSKVFFVIAFNDITKVDSIVSDRLKIIYIDPPNIHDKIIICQDKMIPSIMESTKLKDDINIILDKELIEYIIAYKTCDEKGVRQLRKNIEQIFNRLNYDMLIDNLDLVKKEGNNIIITKTYIDKVIKTSKEDNSSYLQMYI